MTDYENMTGEERTARYEAAQAAIVWLHLDVETRAKKAKLQERIFDIGVGIACILVLAIIVVGSVASIA